ncbi:MAG: hypothetical protein WKF92_07415 [Pyrinomonadaceae bacterium]
MAQSALLFALAATGFILPGGRGVLFSVVIVYLAHAICGLKAVLLGRAWN